MTGKCRGLEAGKCILWRLTICPRTVIGLNCLGTGCVCVHRGVCIMQEEGLSRLRRAVQKFSCGWVCVRARVRVCIRTHLDSPSQRKTLSSIQVKPSWQHLWHSVDNHKKRGNIVKKQKCEVYDFIKACAVILLLKQIILNNVLMMIIIVSFILYTYWFCVVCKSPREKYCFKKDLCKLNNILILIIIVDLFLY